MAGIGTMLDACEQMCMIIPGVGGVYTDDPTEIDPSQYPYIVISDTAQREERHGYGGALHQGRKWVRHTMTFEIHDQTPNIDGAQRGFYDFVDTIRNAFRLNQNLGGVALRFGEDIQVDHGEPAANVTQIMFNATITSEALEEIIG